MQSINFTPKNPNRIGIIILSFLLLVMMMAAFSCSPEKRLARLLRKNPGLIKVDTIWKKDSIIIRERRVDTLFYYKQYDTIIKEQNGAVIKYYYNSSDSTVYLEGKCKGDTIYKYYPVQINSVVSTKNLTMWEKFKLWLFDNWWWIALIVFALWTIFKKAIKVRFPKLF